MDQNFFYSFFLINLNHTFSKSNNLNLYIFIINYYDYLLITIIIIHQNVINC
jgi:hypothetical protein